MRRDYIPFIPPGLCPEAIQELESIFIFVRIFPLATVKALVMFSVLFSVYIEVKEKRKTLGSLSPVNILDVLPV